MVVVEALWWSVAVGCQPYATEVFMEPPAEKLTGLGVVDDLVIPVEGPGNLGGHDPIDRAYGICHGKESAVGPLVLGDRP